MQSISSEPPCHRRAFSLVEVLTVLAIIGVLTLVSMPYFVKSIRGNRLRVATGTLVQAGRYARSLALMGEQEMRLSLDVGAATLQVGPRYSGARPPEADGFGAQEADRQAGDAERETVASPDTNDAPRRFSPGLSVTRKLDAVRIDYVEVAHQDRETTGTVTIIYRSNGRCPPYVVRLVDESGSATLTRVDALSNPSSERDDR